MFALTPKTSPCSLCAQPVREFIAPRPGRRASPEVSCGAPVGLKSRYPTSRRKRSWGSCATSSGSGWSAASSAPFSSGASTWPSAATRRGCCQPSRLSLASSSGQPWGRSYSPGTNAVSLDAPPPFLGGYSRPWGSVCGTARRVVSFPSLASGEQIRQGDEPKVVHDEFDGVTVVLEHGQGFLFVGGLPDWVAVPPQAAGQSMAHAVLVLEDQNAWPVRQPGRT